MTRASTATLIPLDSWAKTFGVNPIHFSGAHGGIFWPLTHQCNMVWPQYDWQGDDLTSREELARLMAVAEQQVADELGYDVAYSWVEAEEHRWPHHRRVTPIAGHLDVRGNFLRFNTRRARLVAPGRRAVTSIALAETVTYSDADGDGWNETATISLAYADSPPTDEIHLYFAGKDAAAVWQIRPLRSVTLSGGTLTVTADSWLFIDPDLWEQIPTEYPTPPIDVSTVDNFVTTVDVYRVYNDSTQPSVEFVWDEHCLIPGEATQTGLLNIVAHEPGLVSLYPAEYSAGAGWVWRDYSKLYDPKTASLWYYAGLDTRHRDYHAIVEAVCYLVAARLSKPVCACGNVGNVVKELQKDVTSLSRDQGRFAPPDSYIFRNPFGTRVGEIRAWQSVGRIIGDKTMSAGAI